MTDSSVRKDLKKSLKTETVIYFKKIRKAVPVIKIVDNGKNQVILAFIGLKGEHLTLHLQKDGKILATYSSSDKPKSVWDEERVKIARKLGYRNPEKHGQYYFHQYVSEFTNNDEGYLIGRLVDLAVLEYKDYRNKIIFNAPCEKFMLYVQFFNKKYDKKYSIVTSLGIIVLKFEKI